MAVDKPADYVGNHGGAYVDETGQTKQFTYIDHDIKPKISNYIPDGDIKEKLKNDRKDLIDRILLIPATFCSDIFQETFTTRDTSVEWNEVMLKDAGIGMDRLRAIYTLSSKKQDFHKRGITL